MGISQLFNAFEDLLLCLFADLSIAGLAKCWCWHTGNDGGTIELTWERQRLTAQVFLEAVSC